MGRKNKNTTPIENKAIGVETQTLISGHVEIKKDTYDVIFLKDWFNKYGWVRKDQKMKITSKEFEELSKLNFVKEV